MQRIIVDGYNVIHADPELRRAADGSIEAARSGLLERLATYVALRQVQVTVVFDGAGFLVDGEAPVPGRLQVLFSARGETADEVIVATLHRHANPREFIVVTSDMADIGRAARAIGATVMPSEEFLQRIEPQLPQDKERDGDGDDAGSREDLEYWLERFERRRAGDEE